MIATSRRPAPYVPLRHARTGRVGADGRLPHGWIGEHTSEVTVQDVDTSEERPKLVVQFKFDAEAASDYIGLAVGQYLPAPRDALVVLAAELAISERVNLAAAFLIVREWREGGEFVRQSTRPLKLDDAPQIGMVAHEVGGDTRVAQPVLMVKRQTPGPGVLAVTLRGLAFGNLYDHPGWLQA